MNTHRPSRKARRSDSQAGFTFVEVIISVVILTMITGALSGAFVASLKASKVSSERVHESNDAQLIAAYFNRDAQATGGGPGTEAPSSSSAISTTDSAGCTVTGGTLIVRFEWIDPSTNTTHIATYFTQPLTATPGANRLIRTTCVTPLGGSTTPTSSQRLADRVTTTTGSTPSPVAWCDSNLSCQSDPFPQTVSMQITELNTPVVTNAQDTFTLTANVRPQNPTFDGAIPTPLVILGRPGVCGGSDGTTGLGVSLGTLNVYGRTYVNAVDNGGTCSAMDLAVAGSYQGGITSLVSGGNCSVNLQLWAQPCPTAPFLTTNNPPIDNPYANLPPMTPAVMATLGPGGTPLTAKSGCSGPGIYAATLSITSTCTLAAGVYILHNGISIAGLFANLTGNGVLLYIDHGGFNANGAGTISLTGLAGNTAATAPYAGLAIWKSDNSTISCNGLLTSSAAGVCFQGSFFSGASIQGVVYTPQSSVVNQLAIFSSTSFKGIVAQAVVVSEGLGGTTSIGTPSGTQPNITTASLPSSTVNRPYPSTTLAATGGTPPYWWQTTGNTSLPAGLTLDGNTGTISGTPTATGTTTVKISATDILGQSATKTFNITINAVPAIMTTPPDWTVGFIYDNFPMQVSGGTALFTWTATLPTGLSINAQTGIISGKPTTVGPFNATVNVTDAAGATSTGSYTMHINLAPTINGPNVLPPWTQGVLYPNTPITTANGTAPFTWAASGLPIGLSIDRNSGTISGTPTVAGTYSTVTVTATDTAGAAATKTYSVVINGPLGLGGSLPDGEINRPYNYAVVPTGGTAPFKFSIIGGALPAGLTMSVGGVISGTPTAVGAPSVTIQVKDSTGATTSKTYTLTIVATPTITGPALPNWTINRNYPGTQMTATGGIAPFTYSAGNTLPAGLVMSSGGLITGIPTAIGTSSVVVTLTDGTGFQTTMSYAVTINGPPSITTSSLLPGEATVAYSMTMAASGGTITTLTPYTWTVPGGMPAGLLLSTGGVISGTPTASGVFPLNITVIDNAGASASLPFTLTIAQGPQNGLATLPSGQVGVAYPSTTLTGTSGAPPYTFSVNGGLPPGLSLTGGVISGTPTTAGTYPNVQITIHDSGGGIQTTTYTITIAAALTISTVSLPAAPVGQSYSALISATGGTPPYTFSATGGLPPGLAISAGGIVSGIPTTPGNYTIAAKVTDSVGTVATKNVTIAEDALPTITSVSPTSRGQGAQNQTITINGTSFVNGPSLAVTFSNPGITLVAPPTFVNAGSITVPINVSATAATGTVTMTNGDGGLATNSVAFTVNAKPTITTVNPTTHSCFFFGCSGFVVTITGTGFVTGSTTVALNATSGTGPTITNTAWTGTTQIKITINIPGFVTSTDNVVVTNPDGGQVTKIGGFATT